MRPQSTTPTWIIELKKRLADEKLEEKRSKPKPQSKKTNKQKSRDRRKVEKRVAPKKTHGHKRTESELAFELLLSECLPPEIEWDAEVKIGYYRADFLVFKKKIVFEIDGEIHFFQGKRDAIRTKYLRKHGYSVHRFTNHEVNSDPWSVRNEVLRLCVGEHAVYQQ